MIISSAIKGKVYKMKEHSETEHRIELPVAYVNLIDAALKYAKEHGLYEGTPDAEFVQGCIEDIEESLIKPLQELDKDGIIIIKE